jgi:hypothetical protein
MIDSSINTIIVSFEAGGAQILSSLIRKSYTHSRFLYCLDGPALKIFKSKISNMKFVSMDYLECVESDSCQILTGTSRSQEFERDILSLAKKRNIKTISLLEHWTNFRERFLPYQLWSSIPDDWWDYLPDEVWVCDEYAYKLAIEDGFPKEKLRQIENPYHQELQDKWHRKKNLAPENTGQQKRILYVCEQIAEDMKATFGDPYYWGYTEFEQVQDIVEFVKRNQNIIEVRLRLHPNEDRNKYDNLIEGVQSINKSKNFDLFDDLLWADALVGGESMALVHGLLVDKPVFSCVPSDSKHKCVLPFKQIFHVNTWDEILEEMRERCKLV